MTEYKPLSAYPCRDCAFYQPAFANADEQAGHCHRYASAKDGWPIVQATDWCGDWRHDLSRFPNGYTPK